MQKSLMDVAIVNGEYMLELRRFAIAPTAPKNTASRMLKIMRGIIKREYINVFRLISYQDTDKHNGTIYAASGWTKNEPKNYLSWSVHSKRPGKLEQSTSAKIRWSMDIRPLDSIDRNLTTHAADKNGKQLSMDLGS